MINYNHIKVRGNLVRVEVKMEGKLVGEIRPIEKGADKGGWAYFPKSTGSFRGDHGKPYSTVEAVKRSLVTDEEEDQTPPVPDMGEMDFEDKVRADFYKNPLPYGPSVEAKAAYRQKEGEVTAQFAADLRTWLATRVPAQYVDKVASAAWSDGHSSGYNEVLNAAYKFVEIFS